MEAQNGEEVRKLQIIYFLSREGRIEHPHLIRVHHLSINIGIRLRDVKRWLGELRGKDMPKSFAWSYKRKYKCGYVWEDLLDEEDLITPISHNEYVLKGYQISSFSSNKDYLYGEKKTSMQKEPPLEEIQEHFKRSMVVSRKSSSEIEESPVFGSETTTLSHDSTKEIRNINQSEKVENSSTKKNTISSSVTTEKTNSSSSTTRQSDSSFDKSRGYSSGASQIFRSIITCGALEINDSAMVTINRRNKPSLNMSYSHKVNNNTAQVSKREVTGGSPRIFSKQSQQIGDRNSCGGVTDSTTICSPRTASASYMPVNGPTCSQCGKQFKPEKLQNHMKSCKVMKAIAKGTKPSIEKTSQSWTRFSH